jgi:hypothetical protein
MWDIERYWDITEGVRDIMGNKERYLAVTGFLGLIMRWPDTKWGITKVFLAKLGCPLGNMDITEGFRAKLGFLVGWTSWRAPGPT